MFARERKGDGGPAAGPERAPGVMRELLGVGELCQIVGLSRRTVYRLADAGRLPFGFKLGGSRRWRRSEIQRWLDAGCPRCDERGQA